MGGTFDPIHIGHLILGESAWDQLSLDQVLFIPAGNPPHKLDRTGGATDEQRMEMVRLAIDGNPHFALSGIEMGSRERTYTYRTLERMRAEAPDRELYFIIGADSLFDFTGWREPARICRACTLVAAMRNHVGDAALDAQIALIREKFDARIVKLHTGNIDVSSHGIRESVERGRSVRYYVPDRVAAYMEANGIYRHFSGQ